MFTRRSATTNAPMRPPAQIRGRALLAAVLTITTTLAPGLAQGPPDGGQSGPSDRRAADPCEKAAKPEGHAHGLRSQCEPPGGGGGSAKGDFNGDGVGDLAIGAPAEDLVRAEETVIKDAGVVHVIYGTADGLSSAGNQLLHQDVAGVNGTPTTNDKFGWALASGRFNNDTYSDLAVGVPGETVGGIVSGVVQVFYGSASGLRVDNDQFWDYQDLPPDFRYYNPWADTYENVMQRLIQVS